MGGLPAGTVTFLFTDVEGSTRRARALGGERWAEVLEAHRVILREAFAAHGGHEVDTQGDSFFVAFQRTSHAAAAAMEGQRTLGVHEWPEDGEVRVRMGLHTGEAILRDRAYAGPEVHRASRVCDAGHGGQTVVSQATAELLRGALSDGVTLTDLGRYRLKDFDVAAPLFQISAPDLRQEFPPLRAQEEKRCSLPAQRSSFVGREKEVAEVRSLLEEERIVTLTGMGGAGKTRLALAVGVGSAGAFPDGVFFADLSPVADPDLVASTVATAAGLTPGSRPPADGYSSSDSSNGSFRFWRTTGRRGSSAPSGISKGPSKWGAPITGR